MGSAYLSSLWVFMGGGPVKQHIQGVDMSLVMWAGIHVEGV